MDIKSFKDVAFLKKSAKDVVKVLVSEVDKLKDVTKDGFVKAFDKYFLGYLKSDYIKFDGTVSRRQYWMYVLFAVLIASIFGIFSFTLFKIYCWATLIPFIGISVRRLRELNLPIYLIALLILPIIGLLVLWFVLSLPVEKKQKA